jgi:hypothetical protein
MGAMGDSENEDIYCERYVAFVDILGFSDIVRNSERSPHQAMALVRVLERIRARSLGGAADDLFGDDFKVQSFSDTIVLSEKVTETGLKWLLYSVADLTLDLLAQGILTRGGITKGLMYHSEGVAFGPAFLSAYYLESTIAKYPRVVVDRSVHIDYRARNRDRWETGEFAPRLMHADDGPVYLDIFRKFAKLSGPHIASQLIVTGQSCRACIQNLLNDSIYNPRHFEKLRWLAIYWNSVRLGQPPTDLLEPVDFPSMKNLDDS